MISVLWVGVGMVWVLMVRSNYLTKSRQIERGKRQFRLTALPPDMVHDFPKQSHNSPAINETLRKSISSLFRNSRLLTPSFTIATFPISVFNRSRRDPFMIRSQLTEFMRRM